MKASLRWLVILSFAALPGCRGCGGGSSSDGGSGGGGGGGGGGNSGLVADIDADADRNGTTDNTDADDVGEDVWNASKGAVFYWNIDDDDTPNDNIHDWNDSVTNGATDINDLARVFVRKYTGTGLTGGTVTVLVGPAAAQAGVKIWRNNGGWSLLYSVGASFTLPAADVIAGDVELGIEGSKRIQATWDGTLTLTLELRDSTAALLSSDIVTLKCAPFLMATNLWRSEQIHVVNVTSGSGNATFRSQIQGVASASGTTYIEAPGGSYNNDRWIQDSSEPGIVYLPSTTGRRRVDVVCQLARWREVDLWCRNTLWAPEFDFLERFSANSNSLNYGGNTECVPPHTSAAGTFDWGRVLIGGGSSFKIGTTTTVTRYQTVEYREFWNALKYQGPHLQIHTEWLAVGHVDEILAFLPAPNTTRGWVVALSSPNLAKTILQNVQSTGGGAKAVFAGRTGWATTVDAILADTALMTYNQEVQLRMDEVRSYLKTEIGLADSEIIDIPTFYENVGNNNSAAYNPGCANIMPLVSATGSIHLIIPDPEGPDHPSTDAWQADILTKFNALGTASKPVTSTFVDVFFSYHTLLGEAHCGLNTVRTPPAMDWWNK